jgi:hypothetical protein
MARRRSEAIAPPSAPDGDVPAEVIAAPRARWSALRTPLRTITLSREAELAYIRADMRRLFIIAGLLLILMMVILVIVER